MFNGYYITVNCLLIMSVLFLCRLQSIATHRDHFVRRPSVCLSVRPSVCLSVRLSHFPKLCFAGDTCIPQNAATIFANIKCRKYFLYVHFILEFRYKIDRQFTVIYYIHYTMYTWISTSILIQSYILLVCCQCLRHTSNCNGHLMKVYSETSDASVFMKSRLTYVGGKPREI